MVRDSGWEAALRAFGDRVTAQREALVDGDPSCIPPFAPPPELGPLPAGLRDRAASLLQETAELAAELEAALAATAREEIALRRLLTARTTPTLPHFVDRAL